MIFPVIAVLCMLTGYIIAVGTMLGCSRGQHKVLFQLYAPVFFTFQIMWKMCMCP